MYIILSAMIGAWMFYDFKRIGYTSRLRYLYLVLCMVVQPLIFVYLFLSRKERRTADNRVLFTAWTIPLLLVCLVLWHQLFMSYPIMLENTYSSMKGSEAEASDVQEAKRFLRNAGISEYYDGSLLGDQAMVYLKEQLDETAVLQARGELRTYGQSDVAAKLLETDFPAYELAGWVFRVGSDERTGKEIYAVVTCIDWAEDTVLHEGDFVIELQDGFEMEGRNGFFRIWAEDGSKVYYRDEAFSGIGFDMNSFHFYGKSVWKKYSYHACVVTYIMGEKLPEYVTLTISQQKNGIYGQDQAVYSRNYMFHEEID